MIAKQQYKKSRPKKNRRQRPVRDDAPRFDRHPLPAPELAVPVVVTEPGQFDYASLPVEAS